MLQQNNNNNYPCLNVSASTKEMLQKCPKGPLLFPSRLDLGFGDLPLVRGLRAWALFSKNRRKAGELVGGIQAPADPPAAAQGNPSPCPRPADVYEEWDRMGYGLPLGVNVRQAGIGALVTVATLKTSEGGGKTQTQCLLLRTEKGSCLYSTTKPGACSLGMSTGMSHTGPSTLVGGWLRGKVGGGGGGSREPPVGRRDSGPTPPVCINRVRVRSGRRWRKSCGTAAAGSAQERTGLKKREKRAREEEEAGAGGVIPQEKQEERDKGGFPGDSVSTEQAPCSLQDGRGPKPDNEGANRSPRHCDDTSDKTCVPCLRRGTGGEQGGRDGDKRSAGDAIRLADELEEMKKAKEEEDMMEKREGLTRLKSHDSSVPPSSLELNPSDPESQSSCEARDEVTEETRETWAALQAQTSQCEHFYSERGDEVSSQIGESDIAKGDVRMHIGNCDSINDDPDISSDFTPRHNGDGNDTGVIVSLTCAAAPKHLHEMVNTRTGSIDLERGNKAARESANSESPEDEGKSNICLSLDMSHCSEEDTFPLSSHCSSHHPIPHSPFKTTEPSSPVEGSTSTVELGSGTGWVAQENNSTDNTQYSNNTEPIGESNSGVLDTAELDPKLVEELDNTSLLQALNSGNAMCYVENVVGPVTDSFNEPGSELNKDTQSISEKDRGPSTNSLESPSENSKDRQVQEESSRTPPRQIKVQGHGDASVFETAVGLSRATEEQDKKAIEEGECSGTELNDVTENEKGDEATREYRGEERGKVQEGENFAWQQETVESKKEEIRRKESNEGLEDATIKGRDKNERNAGEQLNDFTSECIRQESADVWRTERFPEDIGKAGEWEEAKNREAVACSLVNSVPCGSFFRTSNTTANISGAAVNEETSGPLSRNPSSSTTTATTANSARPDPSASHAPSPANPAPPLPPMGAMATGLPRLEVGVATVTGGKLEGGSERGNEGDSTALASGEEEERGRDDDGDGDEAWSDTTVATEPGVPNRGRQEEDAEEEEDEFGVFMQAEGDPAWCKGFAMSAPVPCGKRGSVALGNHVIPDEATHWTSGWVDGSSHQSEDTWTAFPQDSLAGGQDTAGQWWPVSAVEERDTPSTNQNLSAVFAEAFPSLPVPHCCDPDAVPTLTQLLRGEPDSTRATQDQGLLDSFHDLNKMIDQRYKRASGVSRDRLLQCLQLGNSYAEDSPLKANHRLSPGLPSTNQHAQTTAAKRRLSYDHNRNVME